MLQIPDFIDDISVLKAVYGDDELYLDEDGKHIIFRNVRGKVVPMHVDSSDYVDWLRDQGIPIDNTSQENMAQAEQILDYLDRVREVAGPEMASKYEDQILEKYKEYYTQASQLGYQQALQKRAAAKGMSSEDLQTQYKQTYEQNKQNTVKASSDRSSEWAAFIGTYTEKLLANSPNKEVSSNEWGISQAFDLAMMTALKKAKRGEAPTTVSLLDILKHESKTRDESSKLFDTRYDPKTNQQDSGVAAISLVDGIDNLLHNVDTSTEFGKSMEAVFDKMYVRMFNDFDKPNQKKLSPLAGNMIPHDNFQVPDDLPETFDDQEANRLVGIYKSQTGSKLSAAHKVMLHTLGRLWDHIPQDKQVAAFSQLNDPDKGIHHVHKLNFIRAFQDSSKGIREYNPDRIIEESLREALHVKDSQNYNEIVSAIKAITVQMAHLDGYYASKGTNGATPGPREIISLWNNSPVLAGRTRSRGEGPNLLQFFSDETARNGVIYPNSVLKVVHQGRQPKPNVYQQIDMSFEDSTTPEPQDVKAPESTPQQPKNDLLGWRQDRNKFVDDSTGTEVTMTPVKLPSGATGLKLSINRKGQITEVDAPILSKGKSKEDVMREVIGVVKSEGMRQGEAPKPSAEPKPDKPKPSAPKPRSAPSSAADGDALQLQKSIMDSAVGFGWRLEHITGNAYAVVDSQDKNKFHRVSINKDGKVVVSIKSGTKWENHVIGSSEEGLNLMKLQPSTVAPAATSGGIDLQALGEITPQETSAIQAGLTQASSSGLTHRILGSTKSLRIQNQANRSKGYISIANRDGAVTAHLVTPDGSITEIPLDKLAQETGKLL